MKIIEDLMTKMNIIDIEEIDEPKIGRWNPSSVGYLKAFGIYDLYGNFFDHTNEQRMYNKFGDKILTRDRNKYYFVINTSHKNYNDDHARLLNHFNSDIKSYIRKKSLNSILK